ncbi:unnamed protein product [Heterobilharzia americana]|nr:unnamed protein product [Heterobilharzia americana]
MASPGLKRRIFSSDTLNPTVTVNHNPVRAFYELPKGKPIAAQIVKESRNWLRSVSTCRPFTPKDKTRTLFNTTSQTRTGYRPSSSFKVTAKCFDPYETTFKPGVQLEPIDTKSKNVRKQLKPGKPVANTSVQRSSQKSDDRINDSYAASSSSQSLGSTEEYISNVSHKSSPHLELIGRQTRLISPINMKRSAYLNVKAERCITPRISNTSLIEALRTSNVKKRLLNTQEETTNPSQLSTLSSLDDNQSPRPNSPTDLFLSPIRTTLILEEDKYHLRPNGVRSAVTGTSANTEFAKTITDKNKPKSSGPYAKHQRSVDYDINKINLRDNLQTFASGDSGLSSATELDHLIYQLSELSFLSSSSVPTALSSSSNKSNSGNSELEIFDSHKASHSKQQIKSKSNDGISTICTQHQEFEDVEEHSTLFVNKLNEDEIIDLLNRIHDQINEFGLDGNQNWSNRSMLLKALFDLINYPSPKLHLTIARLMFSMNVTGRNLLNICKIVYRVAKNADNDYLFLENPNTLDTLIRAIQLIELPIQSLSSSSPTANSSSYVFKNDLLQNPALFCMKLESLLFLSGTMKFLISNINFTRKFHSNSNFLQNLILVHRQTFELMVFLCKNPKCLHKLCTCEKDVCNNKDASQGFKFIQHSYHILLQVTEIFCHLSSVELFRPQLISPDGILEHVINCIINYHEHVIHKQSRINYTQVVTAASDHSDINTIYFNWIRFLSHLTEHADVCYRLENWLIPSKDRDTMNLYTNKKKDSSINTLINSIYLYKEKEDLVVRISYVLGNLAARCERARVAILPDQECLLKLCDFCRQYNSTISTNGSDNLKVQTDSSILNNSEKDLTKSNNSDFSNDVVTFKEDKSDRSMNLLQYDTLVKLLRIIANVTISETAGFLCTANFDCINLILEIIDGQHIGEPNELLLNCFACLNNLTYYIKQELTEESVRKQCEIAECLLRVMRKIVGHQDEFLGVIRVFGNLTRHTPIRQWLVSNSNILLQISTLKESTTNNTDLFDKNDDLALNTSYRQNAFLYLLIQALDSSRADHVYSTLGVLINLMTDFEHRPMLRTLGGLTKLVEILRNFAGHDWQLAGLACKTLWNYTDLVDASMGELFDPEIMIDLSNLLTEFTDENAVARLHQGLLSDNLMIESDCLSLWEAAWSNEFLPVASDLLHRLSNHMNTDKPKQLRKFQTNSTALQYTL